MRLPLEQKRKVWKRVQYESTPAALDIHACDSRLVLVAGGERGSKSRSAAAEALPHACLANELGWIVAPTYDLALPEFNYLLENLNTLGIVRNASIPMHGQRVIVTALNQRIVTRSADDVMKLAAEAPGWIIACEAAQLPYEAFLRLRGRIAQKRGWLWMSGTFEGSVGWYPEKFTLWQVENNEDGGRSYSLPSWTNTYIYPGGREDPEIKKLEALYGHDLFLERCGGVPCPPSNLVLKEFRVTAHVHSAIQFDPKEPVEIWLDPGYSGSHYAVEFVQLMPRWRTIKALPHLKLPDVPLTDIWVVNEIYAHLAITHEVINMARELPEWSQVKGGVGDVAIMQHHAMPSHYETWLKQTGFALRGKLIGIEDNVARHRSFLKDPLTASPRLFFNPRCKGALGEYGRWKRKVLGENMYGEPEKINCDALKAIGYGLIDHYGAADATRQALPRKRRNPYAFLD